MKYLLVLVALFVVRSSGAQVFKNDVPLFGDEPFFNELWASSNRVREIRGEVSFKRDGFPIADSRQFYHYRFDRLGRLIASITTFKIQNRTDTISIYYFYHESGLLSKMVKSDAYGYFAMNYLYDRNGKIAKQFHSRETRNEGNEVTFSLEEIVWEDSVSHLELSSRITKSSYHNKIGKAYKEVSAFYDENTQLKSIESLNLIGNDLTVATFGRNEDGRLTNWEEKSNMQYSNHLQKQFTYDNEGRIDSETVHKNGKLQHSRKVTYNEKGLMDLQLTRNRITGVMEIVQYRYSFY